MLVRPSCLCRVLKDGALMLVRPSCLCRVLKDGALMLVRLYSLPTDLRQLRAIARKECGVQQTQQALAQTQQQEQQQQRQQRQQQGPPASSTAVRHLGAGHAALHCNKGCACVPKPLLAANQDRSSVAAPPLHTAPIPTQQAAVLPFLSPCT